MNIDLSIHTDLARKILTGFIRSEITRFGFTRAVLGLSGGIDSALSCALAAEADFIVSGDKKHLLALRQFQGIPIISPAEFLRRLHPRNFPD